MLVTIISDENNGERCVVITTVIIKTMTMIMQNAIM